MFYEDSKTTNRDRNSMQIPSKKEQQEDFQGRIMARINSLSFFSPQRESEITVRSFAPKLRYWMFLSLFIDLGISLSLLYEKSIYSRFERLDKSSVGINLS